MKLTNVILVMVGLTLMMQGALLYQQFRGSSSAAPNVVDVTEGVVLDITPLPVKGSTKAKVVMVEFSDYECPFCAKHATGVGQDIDKEFIATGKLRQAFANNPLRSHRNAKLLALAAICAGEQNRYWEMHDALFSETPSTKDEIIALAENLSVDSDPFQSCLENSVEPTKRIDEDTKKAQELAFKGTPAFAIGIVDEQGRIEIKKFIMGAAPLHVFEKAINEALTKANAS